VRLGAPLRWAIGAAVVAGAAGLIVAFVVAENDDKGPNEEGELTPFREAIAAAPQRLSQLPSYAYTTRLETELPGAGDELGATSAAARADGEVIPPDRLRQVATASVGAIDAEEELVRVPEGDFIKRPDGYFEGLGELNTFLLSAPSLWSELAGVAQLFPADPPGVADEVDGVTAVRYHADEVRLLLIKDHVLRLFGAVASAEELPDFYEVEVWLSEENGTLLRISIHGERMDAQEQMVTFELESSVTDIGDHFVIELE
jgi:hypothetical protein